ncbi:MAG: hypothetical protein KDB36_16070, partial [Acidimicrobiales bacterium]|nr:hypothetical protein [Acidimicrobiales bacterium]
GRTDDAPAVDAAAPKPAAGTFTADRRQVLTRAAAVAAGAVAGGAALAVTSASPAAAVPGTFTGNPAVTATSVGGTGVYGASDFGVGIDGRTGGVGTAISGNNDNNGTGVRGYCNSGRGVFADSLSGVGLEAKSVNGRGITSTGGTIAIESVPAVNAVHLQLANNDAIAPPLTNIRARTKGAIVFDANEDLWLCIASGTPGVWRRLGGASSSGAFTALSTPARVYDSRAGYPPAVGTKAPLAPNTARTCDLKANGSGVPAGATAVLVSVVATQTTGTSGGFLSVYRNGIAWPGTSNLNWSGPNQNVAVTTVTAVDASAICNLYASQVTNVVVDVLGYYR